MNRKQGGHSLNINYSSLDLANFSFQSFIPCHLFGDFIISHGNGAGHGGIILFNPVFQMQTNNSFKFFGIVGHQ
jgi:hypothetical protein